MQDLFSQGLSMQAGTAKLSNSLRFGGVGDSKHRRIPGVTGRTSTPAVAHQG